MTPLTRGLIGAGIGAVLVLSIFPPTRAYLRMPFVGPDTFNAALRDAWVQPSDPLPAPEYPSQAALYVQEATQKLANAQTLDRSELADLIRICQASTAAEPDNSFWLQMESCFLKIQGNQEQSLKLWQLASRKLQWSDHQSNRLSEAQNILGKSLGQSPSWVAAWLYYLRSQTPVELLKRQAIWVLDRADSSPNESLNLRFATLQNGALIRIGAKSNQAGSIGADIVELSCHPKAVRFTARRLITAQVTFVEELRKNKMPEAADAAQNAFDSNLSWLALTQRASNKEKVRLVATQSAMLSVVPPGLFLACLTGAVLWGFGRWLKRVDVGNLKYTQAILPSFALAFGLLAWVLTQDPILTVAVPCCVLFCRLSPRQTRSKRLTYLGPLFQIFAGAEVVILIAVSLAVTLAFHPARELVLSYSWPTFADLSRPQFAVSIFLVLLGVITLLCPLWAFVKRLPSLWVLGLTYSTVGRSLTLTSLACILVGPALTLYQDQKNLVTLTELMKNEPVHSINSQ